MVTIILEGHLGVNVTQLQIKLSLNYNIHTLRVVTYELNTQFFFTCWASRLIIKFYMAILTQH